MYFFEPMEKDPRELAAGILARTFWGEKMLMSVVDLEPNAEMPLHSHPHEQVGMILSGAFEMEIGGEKRLLKAGDVYVIPGDVSHCGRSLESAVKVLDVFSPVREDYKD